MVAAAGWLEKIPVGLLQCLLLATLLTFIHFALPNREVRENGEVNFRLDCLYLRYLFSGVCFVSYAFIFAPSPRWILAILFVPAGLGIGVFVGRESAKRLVSRFSDRRLVGAVGQEAGLIRLHVIVYSCFLAAALALHAGQSIRLTVVRVFVEGTSLWVLAGGGAALLATGYSLWKAARGDPDNKLDPLTFLLIPVPKTVNADRNTSDHSFDKG